MGDGGIPALFLTFHPAAAIADSSRQVGYGLLGHATFYVIKKTPDFGQPYLLHARSEFDEKDTAGVGKNRGR
jgi:hypothetical protein